jgi:hypothetical protein
MNKYERLLAEEHWQRARRKVLYDEVVCLIRRCTVNMLSFDEVQADLHLRQKVNRGLQTISLDSIQGSVGRFNDFTNAFLPRSEHLHDRWINVDVALKRGKTPPIDVYQVGDTYFIVDGNHRVSAARQEGWTEIEAYVTEFVTPVEPGSAAELDEQLVGSEQAAFFEQIGPVADDINQSLVFTCSGCYEDVTAQVENHRRSMEALEGRPVTGREAIENWYQEVYAPTIAAIHSHGLMEQFPKRTEADLFIWAQQNGNALEEIVLKETEE